MKTLNLHSSLASIGLGLVFLLQIIWHMPGTIALRNILLGLFVLATLGMLACSRQKKLLTTAPPSLTIVILAVLTFWIVIVNLFWSDYPEISRAEFFSHWILPVLSYVFAWLFAGNYSQGNAQNMLRLLKVVFWAYFLQVLLHVFMDVGFYLITGDIPFRHAPVLDLPDTLQNLGDLTAYTQAFSGRNPGFFSYVNAILSAFLVAEIAQRFLTHHRKLPYSSALIVVAVVAVLFCSYTLRMRNGNVGLLLLLFFAATMIGYRKLGAVNPAKYGLILLAFLIALGTIGYFFVKSDQRWQGFVQTVPYAWDTKSHNAWLIGGAYPVMPSGEMVEVSAYERTAWLKEGLSLVAERPLGSGYDRNAWGGRLVDKYQAGILRGGHSHNGLLDFAVATGIPGIALLVGFFGSLAWFGFRTFKEGKVMEGLMLLFLVTGYFGRSMVDSVIRDHFFQVFMFLSGYFLALCQSATGLGSIDQSSGISIDSRRR